jgi:hypothetical protein
MKSYSVMCEIKGTAYTLIEAEDEEDLKHKLEHISDYDFDINE